MPKALAPLDIINGPLMTGMTEVGRLFNNNELIVAEVLQSAEAMKAAVAHLEQFMEKSETAARGKIVLATVKGDVHDIGKNLVEIILSNNGYQVINLGIKVAPEDLIGAWREHKPDAIGLSGLLVKSAHQMVTTASDFKDHGVEVPLLVGGAALSEKFTTTRIGPAYGAPTFYAKDAMTGLRIMNELMDPAQRGNRHQHAHLHDAPERRAPEAAPCVESQHRAQPQGAYRYSDSLRPVSRSPRARGSESHRGLELHQSVHAVRTSSRIQRQFREAAGRARSQGDGIVRRRGASREGSRRVVHEDPRRVAVLRSGARRKRDPPVRAGRAEPLHIVSIRTAAEDRRPVSERLHSGSARTARRDHIGLFVVTAGEGVRAAFGRREAARRVFQSSRHPGAGDRNGRRLRRVAPSPHARGLGLPRSSHA